MQPRPRRATAQPPEQDQIAFRKRLTCTGARRNPAAFGTNQGNSQDDLVGVTAATAMQPRPRRAMAQPAEG